MAFEPEQIIPEIRNGACRKLEVPGFQNESYFADRDGNVYSLYDARNPKCLPPKMGNGLMFVSLYEKEGFIRKLMVGDIMANTFLADQEHDESDTTVIYIDGDSGNNAVNNLKWGTPQQQQSLLREGQLKGSVPETKTTANGRAVQPSKMLNGIDDVPLVPIPAEDPLLDQLHSLQGRLDSSHSREAGLIKALEPFATFELSPAHAIDVGMAVVVESNRGANNYSTLTVFDFRVAKKALQGTVEDTVRTGNA